VLRAGAAVRRGATLMNVLAAEGGLVALAAFAALGGVLSAYGLRVALLGRPFEPRLEAEPGTPLLGRYPIEAFHWVARAAGQLLVRVGISPDALTIASLFITAVTMPLVSTGHFELAGITLLFGAACDTLDGIVARQRGIASNAGEMLDAVVDRYADAFSLCGLAFYYAHQQWQLAIVLITLQGAMMVSYARAKAEALGVNVPATLMRRPERLFYLCGALLVAPSLSVWMFPERTDRPLTLAVVAVIGVVSNTSAVQLLIRARRMLRATGSERRT
jgi:CDP-diacylglycerol--glycerol-3-phosphate 3-phosphatidyltransferase